MKQSILFIVINGDGLGHLTRALAVARRIARINPNAEIIFYTTSLAADVIREIGFSYYYIPARERVPYYMTVKEWETYIQLQLSTIINIHKPRVVVFDGAYPTTAILTPLISEEKVKKIWLKREGDRSTMIKLNIYEQYFDFILVPKEVGLEYDDTDGNKLYFSPILFIDKIESYKRNQVRELLRVEETKNIWYVQMGNEESANYNEIISFVLTILLENKNNIVLLGESIMNKSSNMKHERVITLRNYPNSVYFNAIDFAISAAGYNTFHELLFFKIPSVFVPNNKVLKDDQVARAKRGQDLGVGIALSDTLQLREAIHILGNSRGKIQENYEKLNLINGAYEVAMFVNNLML